MPGPQSGAFGASRFGTQPERENNIVFRGSWPHAGRNVAGQRLTRSAAVGVLAPQGVSHAGLGVNDD